jgi:hypothetical protein
MPRDTGRIAPPPDKSIAVIGAIAIGPTLNRAPHLLPCILASCSRESPSFQLFAFRIQLILASFIVHLVSIPIGRVSTVHHV